MASPLAIGRLKALARAGLAPLAPRRSSIEGELEEARRLGHWFTEEDRQLLREHEARMAGERRALALRKAGRHGALALLAAAWFLPLLWPFAIVGSARAFPRTIRRLGYGLLALTALGVFATGLVLFRLGAGTQLPSSGDVPARILPAAALGRQIAERLYRDCDYWILDATSPDGSSTWRKGLYREWDGRTVMVLPRSSWQALNPIERRALAEHVADDRGVQEIHVGRVEASSRFHGDTIKVEERVWP